MKHVGDTNVNSNRQPQLEKNSATNKKHILRKMDFKFQNTNFNIP